MEQLVPETVPLPVPAVSTVNETPPPLPELTKVVTLSAVSVAENAPFETAMFDCASRLLLGSVRYGVTEDAVRPLKLKGCETELPLPLTATISNAPVLVFLNAVTCTPDCGVCVAAISTWPGRMNFEKLPKA